MRLLRYVWVAILAGLIVPLAAQELHPDAQTEASRADDGADGSPGSARVDGRGSKDALTRADAEAWMDGFMPYALNRGNIAGGVVVIVKDGEVLLQKGYGYSDVAAQKSVDPETTMFRPGSVSKLFTWTAVMQLVEQGKLDLDRDVNDYLDFTIPPYDGQPITLRNVLTHTAGFEETIRGLITDAESVPPLGDVMRGWVPDRIAAPGTTPAYSNYATALAGHIVANVSGMSFDDYIDRHVFAPLDMQHSSFRQPLPERLRPFMSRGYALATGEPKPYEMVGQPPAGSLASSGADMAKFMIAHLDDGGALLAPRTARTMHTTMAPGIPSLNRMALGFYEQDINGHDVIGHGGDTQWFHSYLWLFPDQDVGLYVSLNSAGKDGVTGPIRSALLEEFADRYFPPVGTSPARAVDPQTAAEHARMLVGSYINSRRSDSSFFKALNLVSQLQIQLDEQGKLVADFGGGVSGAPRQWIEVEPFVWHEVGGHGRMAAEVVDGKVVRLSFNEISPFMVFEPAPWYLAADWLIPALVLAMAVLAVTAVSWPIGWIARRRYGAALALTGPSLRAYRLVRGLSGVVVLVLAGWAIAIGSMLADFSLLHGAFDPLVWLLQIAGWIGFIALPVVALWNLWLAWQDKRGWFAISWGVLVFLASIIALWVAAGFKLLDFGTTY